ncbi:ABC transporter ATP-binding protein [Mucilaginibacter rubeus]|uniref:ABC transporter ATP-binding protein n=1 Tax=Mucilaginibacter rubeus TaxID=2027860 RepID=A0AAE6MLB4_9SPHI|nr:MULTISPECIES: ABC transporter ATP-binding protein [Mucilaginibacter]QEM07596.1 ABC transporter ATP-binding protein [Mucilaginibacter rubeus]QEM20050.1 ABC transporter ATP-binding protein [Mucilaginibacter gossypii]QTE43240.1 ABC transporter ATP-binding protein [Mucilaginibacter rubeus]QTE49840.1 ABC transporter ATP-binding protein [Mucilaginibacter rubeus]QTE54932.1 ABC transporter ATP-binding protein [Mucilaginibacter rubeus]
MIEVRNLKKVYNGITVVDVPALQINKGESVGLVGNNGAGKTTLFRMVLDLIRAESGEILSNGETVADHEKWKDYTAAYLDEGFLIDYLTPEEYFYFIGGLHSHNRTYVDEVLVSLTDFFNGEILKKGKYIRDLSKGNQCKVGVAACLLQEPQLLMLDEPFANIDPSTQFRLKSLLKDLNRNKGVTTIVSSHDLNHITDVCDRILLMEKGVIIKDIATSSSTLNELEAYFGVEVAPPAR